MTPSGKRRVVVNLDQVRASDPHSLNKTAAHYINENIKALGIEIIGADNPVQEGMDTSDRVVDEVLETKVKPRVVEELKQIQLEDSDRRNQAGVGDGELLQKSPNEIVNDLRTSQEQMRTSVLGTVVYATTSAVLDFADRFMKGG